MDASINAYVENFSRVYPKTPVNVKANRRGFQVFLNGERVGEPMTRAELEEAGRSFRAPAPRPVPVFTAKLGDIARFKV